MCCVLGAVNRKLPEGKFVELINSLFLEGEIRGLHATGIAWLVEGVLGDFYSEPKPARKFLNNPKIQNAIWNSKFVIGHCRYSTSDLNFNQPIGNESLVVVHNGVITQEDPEKWPEHFGMTNFYTRNDTEILYKAIARGDNVFETLKSASIAALYLQPRQMTFFRNGKRPLYFMDLPEAVIVASTKDILIRSLGRTSIKFSSSEFINSIQEVQPGVMYRVCEHAMEREVLPYSEPDLQHLLGV